MDLSIGGMWRSTVDGVKGWFRAGSPELGAGSNGPPIRDQFTQPSVTHGLDGSGRMTPVQYTATPHGDGSVTITAGSKSRTFSNRAELKKYVEDTAFARSMVMSLVGPGADPMFDAASAYLQNAQGEEAWRAGVASGVFQGSVNFGLTKYQASRKPDGSVTVTLPGTLLRSSESRRFGSRQEMLDFVAQHKPSEEVGIAPPSQDDLFAQALGDYLERQARFEPPASVPNPPPATPGTQRPYLVVKG